MSNNPDKTFWKNSKKSYIEQIKYFEYNPSKKDIELMDKAINDFLLKIPDILKPNYVFKAEAFDSGLLYSSDNPEEFLKEFRDLGFYFDIECSFVGKEYEIDSRISISHKQIDLKLVFESWFIFQDGWEMLYIKGDNKIEKTLRLIKKVVNAKTKTEIKKLIKPYLYSESSKSGNKINLVTSKKNALIELKKKIVKLSNAIKTKPIKATLSPIIESYLKEDQNYSEESLNNFKYNSKENQDARIKRLFYMELGKFSTNFIRSDAKNERKKFVDYYINLNLDSERIINVIHGLRFLYTIFGISSSFLKEIVFKEFVREFLGLEYLNPEILLGNAIYPAIHPSEEQSFFSNLNEFIIKYRDKHKYHLENNSFDKKNKDSIIWCDLISQLINPATNRFFIFDSEFREREKSGDRPEIRDNTELLSPLSLEYHIDQLVIEKGSIDQNIEKLSKIIEQRIAINIFLNKIPQGNYLDESLIIDRFLHTEFFKQWEDHLLESNIDFISYEEAFDNFSKYSKAILKELANNMDLKIGTMRGRFYKYLEER